MCTLYTYLQILVRWTFRTGWRRLTGCLKLQIIFRERATNHRALLRKMTYADKASYDSTPHETEWLQWVMWFVFVTRMSASCRTYKWGSSHLWVSHVTHINEPSHTYEWVMSHIWMSHVSHMNLSCHTYERVTSHIWMSHVTHVNIGKVQISWKQHLQIQYALQPYIWMSHSAHMNESWVTSNVNASWYMSGSCTCAVG